MTYAIALIAALLALLAYALRVLALQSTVIACLLDRNAGLLSAIEYRNEIIIADQCAGDDPVSVEVECQCHRCRAEKWAVN